MFLLLAAAAGAPPPWAAGCGDPQPAGQLWRCGPPGSPETVLLRIRRDWAPRAAQRAAALLGAGAFRSSALSRPASAQGAAVLDPDPDGRLWQVIGPKGAVVRAQESSRSAVLGELCLGDVARAAQAAGPRLLLRPLPAGRPWAGGSGGGWVSAARARDGQPLLRPLPPLPPGGDRLPPAAPACAAGLPRGSIALAGGGAEPRNASLLIALETVANHGLLGGEEPVGSVVSGLSALEAGAALGDCAPLPPDAARSCPAEEGPTDDHTIAEEGTYDWGTHPDPTSSSWYPAPLPARLRVTLPVPTPFDPAGVGVELSAQRLRVRLGGSPRVLQLPYPCEARSARARYDAAARRIAITAKVAPPAGDSGADAAGDGIPSMSDEEWASFLGLYALADMVGMDSVVEGRLAWWRPPRLLAEFRDELFLKWHEPRLRHWSAADPASVAGRYYRMMRARGLLTAANAPDFAVLGEAVDAFAEGDADPNGTPAEDELVVHVRSGDYQTSFARRGGLVGGGTYGDWLRAMRESIGLCRPRVITMLCASHVGDYDGALGNMADDLASLARDLKLHSVEVRHRSSGSSVVGADRDLAYMRRARLLLVHRGGYSALGALLCRGRVFYTDFAEHFRAHEFDPAAGVNAALLARSEAVSVERVGGHIASAWADAWERLAASAQSSK